MAERRWSLITTGATFESLVTTLVFFEDRSATLLGRPGVDGGQDIRSSDGTLVYQAKHHQRPTANKAISDAKKEAKKIAEYLDPEHMRAEQWEGVTTWQLVTNAAFNTTDAQKWQNEVVPIFEQLGLQVQYWEISQLNGLLDKYPGVHQAYFGNETRAFLSLREALDSFRNEDLFLLENESHTFVGREQELETLNEYLQSDESFLVIHGPGGLGKTKLALEAGQHVPTNQWQVLWANIHTMEQHDRWFDAIVPDRPTLLILDEPDDPKLLKILQEQLKNRLSEWKIIITVRTPKDPVLEYLNEPRVRPQVTQLALAPMHEDDSIEMCLQLIEQSTLATRTPQWKKDAARQLANQFDHHPIWMKLAIHLLSSDGNLEALPTQAQGLAEKYVQEIMNHASDQAAVLNLLRWMALLGPVNREHDDLIDWIREQLQAPSTQSILIELRTLVERRALIQRGAWNRLVEIKPDVIRDHILTQWLSIDIGYGPNPIRPSDDANQLVQQISNAIVGEDFEARDEKILDSLGLVENLVAHLNLTGPIFEHIIDRLPHLDAWLRRCLAKRLQPIARLQPHQTIALCQRQRSTPCFDVATPYSTRLYGIDDVLLTLSDFVFQAAYQTTTEADQRRIVDELQHLIDEELRIRQNRQIPPNTSAVKKVENLVNGGPSLASDFDDVLTQKTLNLINLYVNDELNKPSMNVLSAFLKPLLEATREPIWANHGTIIMQRILVNTQHPAWQNQQTIKQRLRQLIEQNNIPQPFKLTLWGALVHAHMSARRTTRNQELRQQLIEDLMWAHRVLQNRQGCIEELSTAREMWIWYIKYDEDQTLKDMACELEALYTNNGLAAEFEWLSRFDTWEVKTKQAQLVAQNLTTGSMENIDQYITRARIFFGNQFHQTNLVWFHLGRQAHHADIVQDWVRRKFTTSSDLETFNAAIEVAKGWVWYLKENDLGATQLIQQLTNTGNDEVKLQWLSKLYDRIYASSFLSSPGEIEFLRSQKELFVRNSQESLFIACIGWTIEHNWEELQNIIDDIIAQSNQAEITNLVNALIDAIQRALYNNSTITIPEDLSQWVLDHVVNLPNANLQGEQSYQLESIIKRAGSLSVDWFVSTLEKRIQMAQQNPNFRILDYKATLSTYIKPMFKNPSHEQRIDMTRLVDLMLREWQILHLSKEIIENIDPNGCVVPEQISERLDTERDMDTFHCLAQLATAYPTNSANWRTIAKSALQRTHTLSDEHTQRLFRNLTFESTISTVSAIGQVPQKYIDDVEDAEHHLDNEQDPDFTPLWRWHLNRTQHTLEHEEQEAKEDRGE